MKQMDQIQNIFREIIDQTHATSSGSDFQYIGLCPSHDDNNPSLSIKIAEDKILVNCHRGCTTKQICSALDIKESDLFNKCGNSKNDQGNAGKKKHFAKVNVKGLVQFYSEKHKQSVNESARYIYHKSDGNEAFHVVRTDPKDFRPLKPNGEMGLDGVERVPYKLPEVLQGIKDSQLILLLEGEKDADRATEMGFVATTFLGGAGKWKAEYLEHFKGADVVLIPDNDQPGFKGMTDIAEDLHGTPSGRGI